MKLLYVQEHLICENYERGAKPLFENFILEKNKVFEKTIEEAEIVFVMKGSLQAFYNGNEYVYEKDNIILLPPACNFKIITNEDVQLVILRIKSSIHLCNIQPLENLLDSNSKKITKVQYFTLTVNERLRNFLDLLANCLDDGLRCKCFIDLKAKEIFYYFRAYYPKELLRDFFMPLLTKDYSFSVFVLQNHTKIKTVQQFADVYGYSLSSFEKQFKKIFRISAYQWMKEQKSKAIYNDLIYSKISLIELTDKYDFSSLSQFCDFCKRAFGSSPGKIRIAQKCPNNFT